jgi:hypothetical protein
MRKLQKNTKSKKSIEKAFFEIKAVKKHSKNLNKIDEIGGR